MPKKKTINLQAPATKFQPSRYVPIPRAAELIGLPVRMLWGWREKATHDEDRVSLFVKPGKTVFFDLDAWASYLEQLQQAAVEGARAWQNRFRAVIVLQTAGAAVIIAALLQGGGRF